MKKGIIIKTAVWGYNYEWYCVKDKLDMHINSDGDLSIEVRYTVLGDSANLKGIIKELRMTYSVDDKHYEILVQEKNGRLLIISSGVATTSDGKGLWIICK